jgi:alanyl-tRNA synthetase
MERIYYTDPSCRAFDAVVTTVVNRDGRPAVILDRTAFYPTSGGQPFDTGRLIAEGVDVAVVETMDDDPAVVHVVSAPLEVGVRVRGEVDWSRRFDHMQQHTGQHVLSAAFDRLFANRTVSFHMGADTSSIDLEREAPPAEIERAVDEANQVIWADRPVSIRFASAEEAARLQLRKEPVRQGTLRLINVEGFDLSACGGTHVATTGAIGIIAVIAAERLRGGSRVTFVCGGRALRTLRQQRDVIAKSVRVLSVLPDDLPAAIERSQVDLKEQRRLIARLQEGLAVHEAARLFGAASAATGTRVVVAVLEGWDAPGLKAVASAMTSMGTVVTALFSSASPAFVVTARSVGVQADAAAALKRLIERFGGRGGGKPDLAQGGGLTGNVDDMCALARELLAGLRPKCLKREVRRSARVSYTRETGHLKVAPTY